jgi:predicted DNA-binding mobile mystery protein A
MNYWDQKLIREQVDLKLKKLSPLLSSNLPENGWIRLIREGLGMSINSLARKVGIDPSRISRLENAEINGDLKLSSLKKIADALDMKFVYGFVPKSSLEEMVNTQAEKVAMERMAKVNHTMRLEAQELSTNEKIKVLNDLIQKILIEQPKDFWDK